jgi:hypothetical protein
MFCMRKVPRKKKEEEGNIRGPLREGAGQRNI